MHAMPSRFVPFHFTLLDGRLGRRSPKQVEDLHQTGSHNDHHEEDNELLGDGRFLLSFFGHPNVDVAALGNVLVEFLVAVANVAGEGLW